MLDVFGGLPGGLVAAGCSSREPASTAPAELAYAACLFRELVAAREAFTEFDPDDLERLKPRIEQFDEAVGVALGQLLAHGAAYVEYVRKAQGAQATKQEAAR